MEAASALFGIAVLAIAIAWVIFPFVVVRRLDRSIKLLEATQAQLTQMNASLGTICAELKRANEMHGDLNRAAQWMVDRESAETR